MAAKKLRKDGKPDRRYLKKKQKTGRKPFVVDMEWFSQMCAIGCTGEEIAACFPRPKGGVGIDYDTLAAALKRQTNRRFSDLLKEKKRIGTASLRRRQHMLAMDGNASMLIWLGKNRLGQTDKQEIELDHGMEGGAVDFTINVVRGKDADDGE